MSVPGLLLIFKVAPLFYFIWVLFFFSQFSISVSFFISCHFECLLHGIFQQENGSHFLAVLILRSKLLAQAFE
jgi:hypothetical protein